MITISYVVTFIVGAAIGAIAMNKFNDHVFRRVARDLGADIRSGKLSLDRLAKGDRTGGR